MAKKKTKVELEFSANTQQFDESIKAMNAEIKTQRKELKLNATELKGDADNADLLAKRQKILTQEQTSCNTKISALNSKIDEAKRLFGDNSKEVKLLNDKLIDAKTQLAGVENEIKSTDAKLNELKNSTTSEKTALEQVGKAANDSARSGFTVLKGTIANLATKALSALGNGLKNAVSGIKDLVSSAAQAGDEIDKQSQKMQVSNEEYQQLSYAANICGTNIETIKKAQKSLQSSGSKLDITEALKECAESSDVAAAATKMFGARTAQELLPMLNQGSKGIEELMNTASDYGMVIGDKAVKSSADYQDSLTTLNTTLGTLKNGLLSNLLPGLTGVLNGFTGLLTGQKNAQGLLTDGVSSMIDSLREYLPKLKLVFKSVLDGLMLILPSIITEILTAIIDMLPMFGDLAISVITTVSSSLIQQVPTILSAVIFIIVALVNTLTESIPTLLPIIVSTVIAICNTLINNIPVLIDAAVKLLLALVEAIPIIIPQLLAAVPQLIDSLVNGLIIAVPTLITGAVKAFMSIVKAIPTVSKSLYENGRKMVDSFLNCFTVIPRTIENLFNSLRNKIRVPHISVTYSTEGTLAKVAEALGLQGFPKLHINWNKFGGVFENKTIVAQGFAEAGDAEMALPLNDRSTAPFAANIASHMPSEDYSGVLHKIYNELAAGNSSITDKIVDAIVNRVVFKLNRREIARAEAR